MAYFKTLYGRRWLWGVRPVLTADCFDFDLEPAKIARVPRSRPLFVRKVGSPGRKDGPAQLAGLRLARLQLALRLALIRNAEAAEDLDSLCEAVARDVLGLAPTDAWPGRTDAAPCNSAG